LAQCLIEFLRNRRKPGLNFPFAQRFEMP
jgi:hypothetical protein